MSTYGLKVYDASGNSSTITSKIGQILSTGSKTMSDSLNGDGTYGEDVSLGDTYARDEIGVIVYPTKYSYKASIVTLGDTNRKDTAFPFCWYADSGANYYTKNHTTKVMTSWSAGNLDQGVHDSFDGVGSVFPLGYWDYADSDTTFSVIRIWSAMAYVVYDASAGGLKFVYTIGNNGVEEVQYIIFTRGT